MRAIAVLGIALAACAAPEIAVAQEPAGSGYHHTVHHHFHNGQRYHVHHFEAHNPAEAPAAGAATAAPQAAPFGLAFPHIAPYPDGKGDEDGLSEDENDCNKGCIDGNTPN